MMRVELALIVCFAIEFALALADLPLTSVVSTTSGDLRGVINRTVNGIRYGSFKGIPYGEKPIRFQEPVPKSRNSHLMLCMKEGNNCIQKDEFTGVVTGSEDCLFLNVYTPVTDFSVPVRHLRAVLFWIHGGAFLHGSGDSCRYGPDHFIQHDLVVVTINYRLGALGWLLIDDPRIPGNAALKDQLLSLKWVRNNIKKFGGDPDRITLAGHSSGGICASTLALSDRAQGLFKQIISLSGTPGSISAMRTRESYQATSFTIGELVNNKNPILTKVELVNVLNSASAELLTNAIFNVTKVLPYFAPALDLDSPNGTTLLDKCFFKKAKQGNSNVPILMGIVKHEIISFAGILQTLEGSVHELLTVLNLSQKQYFHIISQFVGKNVSNYADLNLEMKIDVFSALLLHLGTDLFQRTMCANRNRNRRVEHDAPVYYYIMDFDHKNYSFHHQVYGITSLYGTGHGDELSYFWETCPSILKYPKEPDHPVNVKRRQLTALIANFVKHGNPTPRGHDDPLLNVNWPNSCNGGHHLLIQEALSVQHKRPISALSEALMPLAELKSPLHYDCMVTSESPFDSLFQRNRMYTCK